MRIEVEPQALIDAGKSVGSLGTQLGALSDALGQALASGIASGSDPAGLNFGIGYGRQADQFGKYLADAANAFKNVGLMLEATGYNYQHADQASTAGGSGASGGVSGEPAKTTAADAPYGPNGSLVTPPTKWWLIQPLIRAIPVIGIAAGVAMTWPTGNSGMMNVTAAQWRNIGQGLKIFESALGPAKAAVGAQDIPEGATITTALTDLGSGVTTLAGIADGIATSISDFASGVQETQDAIRSLLDRLSLDGLWDTVTGFLTGDGDKVLREIADDVSTVLENFQSQVKGVLGLLEELGTLLGEAADAFQKWIRPILVGTFGDDVGNLLADGIKFYTDIQVGVGVGVIGLVSGTVALADPDTWKGLADTALMIAKDPSMIDDVLKEVGSEFIALDEWQGDNPGRGLGEAGFNIASLFLPGGPLAKGGSVAKGLAATRNLLEKGDLGPLGRLPGLGGDRTPDMPELPDAPNAPDTPEFTPPPAIPGPVPSPTGAGPGSPSNNGNAPVRPQGADPGTGPGTGGTPTNGSPNGSGASPTGAGPGGPSSGGPAPTGGSPSPGGGDGPGSSAAGGPSSNGPVPTGGSPSSGAGDAPSGSSPTSPSISSPGDSAGSGGGPNKPGGDDGPGLSSSGGGSTSGGGSSGGGDGPGDSSPGGGDRPGDSSSGGGSDSGGGDGPKDSSSDGSGSSPSGDSPGAGDGDTPHSPVHSTEPSGDGWHRIEDKAGDPNYGQPLENYWESGDYPTPTASTQSTFDLIERPDEPYGHDTDGNPLSKAEYDARYNLIGPNGEHWENYPPNDGAVPGSRVVYESGDAFLRDHGQHLDRIGEDGGSYLGVMPEGVPPSFESRGLPISSLNLPYNRFEFTELPEGWSIEVSQIDRAFGRDGGALQVLIYNEVGDKVSVRQLIKDGVLE